MNGTNEGGSSANTLQSAFIRSDAGMITFAEPMSPGVTVLVNGICAGPDLNDNKVYVYVVGDADGNAIFGNIVVNLTSRSAFIWKLSTNLTTVDVRVANSSGMSTATACTVLTHTLAADSPYALIITGQFTGSFAWSTASLSGFLAASVSFFPSPFFLLLPLFFFFIHSFIRTQGFLLAAPFATPAIRGFNAAQLVAVDKSHTTSMTGVFAATFQGSFNDSLGQCTGPAVVDSIAIVTFCLFSFYSFYFL